MLQVESANDVSVTITGLVKGDCPFGVREGGHGAHDLSNAVEYGVTIDFGTLELADLWLHRVPPMD